MLANLVDLVLQMCNSLANAPAVELKPRLARAPGANTTALSREHDAASDEARQKELVLRQLNLHATLVGSRVLREDIEDQRRAIDHAPTGQLVFQVLLRSRRQLVSP